jgi:hypothetical protein
MLVELRRQELEENLDVCFVFELKIICQSLSGVG